MNKIIKPTKGHFYLLNNIVTVATRCWRGTDMVSEKQDIDYSGEYEYLGNRHFFCNQHGMDIFVGNKSFNNMLIKEIFK